MHEQWIPGPFLRFFGWAWVRGYLCSCLCIVCSNVSEALMLALDLCVWFCSCLWIVSVFKALMLALDLCVWFCSCPCSYSVFKCLRSSDYPANSSTPCSPFFNAKAWPVINWPLHVDCGITLWAYLSVHLVQDSHKRLSSTEKTTIPRAPSHVITHYHYVCVTERYTETLYMKKMADLVAVYKFI